MAINSVVKEVCKKDTNFSKLMNTKEGLVVLFETEMRGVVVVSASSDKPIGYYSNQWCMIYFTDFNGTIELSNETI